MLGFPQATEFNKRIPKQKFYENLAGAASLKKAFAKQIKTIYWRNKLSVATLAIDKGEAVGEIEVLELKLSKPFVDEAVLRQIDKQIPYHIVAGNYQKRNPTRKIVFPKSRLTTP